MNRLAVLPFHFLVDVGFGVYFGGPHRNVYQGEPLEMRIGVENLDSALASQLFPLLASGLNYDARYHRPAL